jgi:hypothetical protein
MPNLVTQTVYSPHHCIATAATTDGEKFHLHPIRAIQKIDFQLVYKKKETDAI